MKFGYSILLSFFSLLLTGVNEDEEGKVNMLSDIQIGGSEKTERKQKKKKKDSKEKQLRIHQQQVVSSQLFLMKFDIVSKDITLI